MGFLKSRGEYVSKDGKRKIRYYVYEPKTKINIKGILQISHGMCEYIERYEDLAEFMTDNGWLVCGNDHLGHGEAALEREELGYFSEENGWLHAVDDLHTLQKLVKEKYGDLPYVLLGHSMGSFIARAYVTRYGSRLDGAVLIGTSAGMPRLLGTELATVESFKRTAGEAARSRQLNDIVFSMYNSHIDNPPSEHSWICTDEEVVEKYDNDPLCNFIFTVNGIENLIRVLGYVSKEEWYDSVRTDLPIVLLAGKNDPVGSYGKGVYKVFEKLCDRGCKAELKLYSGMRHEILNEKEKNTVYNDILAFCSRIG